MLKEKDEMIAGLMEEGLCEQIVLNVILHVHVPVFIYGSNVSL